MNGDTEEFVYLTTTGHKSRKPHEIEIWFVEYNGCYYLVAETRERAHWVQNIQNNPQITVQVSRRNERSSRPTYSGVGRIIDRSVEPELARQVALQLMAKDALGAHARDELGISEIVTARPIQAALTSAATFSVGAAAPLVLVLLSPSSLLIPIVAAGSLLFLALLGFLGAKTGGADVLKPIVRVTFWGALAMAVTAGIGSIVGTIV